MITIVTLFGTRPEIIKLAPVISRLVANPGAFVPINVSSSQHTDLLRPFATEFGVHVDHDLHVMRSDQSPSEVCARVLAGFTPLLQKIAPDLVLVQGDTTTTLAGAMAGFFQGIPVGHVEAGLRTQNPRVPFPEEMNRRLVTRLASYHFAATESNRRALIDEGVPEKAIFVTGNPVVDALHQILRRPRPKSDLDRVLDATRDLRRIVLTTHRRESLGNTMRENLAVLRRFVDEHDDCSLVFPVHPNPSVVEAAKSMLQNHPRVFQIEPLDYVNFVHLLSSAWLIVSDSGGVQEEAPSLGKPVLVLRENTERPEAVEAGVAKLVGGDPQRLAILLEQLDRDDSWVRSVRQIENPFGSGDSADRIVSVVAAEFGIPLETASITIENTA